MIDLFNSLKAANQINVAVTSTSARVGAILDRAGYEAVAFFMSAGASTANSTGAVTFSIIAGDSSSLGDGAAVTADDLISNTTAASWTWTSTGDENIMERVGYKGDARYLQLSVCGNSTRSVSCYGVGVFGSPRSAPVST